MAEPHEMIEVELEQVVSLIEELPDDERLGLLSRLELAGVAALVRDIPKVFASLQSEISRFIE